MKQERPVDVPLVSVIIPNWNGMKYLPGCLDALRGQTFRDFEVLLIDNGSTDGSAEFVSEKYPETRIISLGSNLGFSRAVNAGVRESRGGIVALLNNDTSAEPGWIESGVRALESNPGAGIIASRVVFMDRPDVIDSAGDEYAPWGAVFNRGHGRPADENEFRTSREIFGMCASAAFIRRAVFDDIGLFEESFFAYYEDLDFNLRARLRGWKCVYTPEAVVRHSYSGSTVGTAMKLGREEVYIHLTAVWIKNMPAGVIARHVFSAIPFHAMVIFYFVVARLRGAAVMPRVPFFNLMRKMITERKKIQSSRKISNSELSKDFLKMGFIGFAMNELQARRKTKE